MGAGQDRQPDRVGVLLDRGGHDLLGRLVQAGVDDLHPGVPQHPGHHLGAAVMPVEAGLGDDDPDGAHGFLQTEGAANSPATTHRSEPALLTMVRSSRQPARVPLRSMLTAAAAAAPMAVLTAASLCQGWRARAKRQRRSQSRPRSGQSFSIGA